MADITQFPAHAGAAAPIVVPVPKVVGYRRAIDLARFLAAVGIVWDHARAPYADIGYVSLALFLMLTSFLAVQSYERAGPADTGTRRFWLSRAQRIALPWLFWSVVYFFVHHWVTDGEGPWWQIDPFTLLIGSSLHLWFLPFVMIALVLIPPMARAIRTPATVWLACGGLIALSLPLAWVSLPIAWVENSGAFNEPLPQWAFSLPLFLYGAIAALARRLDIVALPVATAAVISLGEYLIEPGFGSVQMIIVALLFEALWRWNLKGAWATVLAGLAFGVYLVHPFFMLVAFKFLGTDTDRAIIGLFTILASVAGTMVLQRLPVVRRFV